MRHLLYIFAILIFIPTLYAGAVVKYDDTLKAAPVNPDTNTVDILWEAETYTPDWYMGRALPSPGSKIRAVAMPDKSYDPNKLTYKWYIGTKLIKRSSGTDANVLIVESPGFYGEYILSVMISDSLGRPVGHNGSKIQSIIPEILLYRHNPLLGILYNNSLTTPRNNVITLQGIEPSLSAEVFYPSVEKGDEPSYGWAINDAVYDKISNNTIRIIKSGSSVNILVEVLNIDNLLPQIRISRLINIPDATKKDVNDSEAETPFNIIR